MPRTRNRATAHTNKAPAPERVARVMLDAEVFGELRAAAKHHIHHSTLARWRYRYGETPEVVAALASFRERVGEEWVDEANTALRGGIDRMRELMRKSKSLGAVTEATRRLFEMSAAYRILEPPDAQRDRAHQPTTARAPEGDGGAAEEPKG